MSVYKIVEHPIIKLGGITKLKVPEGSAVMGVVALENTNDPVHVLVAEPETPPKEEVKFTEILLLSISRQLAFSDPGEDEFLQFVGSVPWDNGHRLHHIFQICKWEDFEDVNGEEAETNEPPILEAEVIEDETE